MEKVKKDIEMVYEPKKDFKKIEDYSKEELDHELRKIQAKQLSNKALTPEENLLLAEYQMKLQSEEEAFRLEEERKQRIEDVKKQKELLKEFDEMSPERKVDADIEGEYLKKGPNAINRFKAKRAMKKVGKKAKTKGGAIIQKVYLDSSIELLWVKTAKEWVEFIRVDDQGNKVRSIARVTKTKHRLKGSSVPVHIAIEGVSENANLLEGINTSLSAQHINQMNQLCYQAGFFDALDAKDQQKKKLDLASASLILMFIIIIVMGYLAWQQMQLFDLVTAAIGG